MRIRNSRALALLGIVTSLAIAGCGGGGKSSLPATSQQLGQKVGVTLTITLGTPPTTQSGARKPAYVPTSAQSLVIDYIGNVAGATPAPGGMNPPSNVITAATVNVTSTTTNPPPAGQCFASGGAYTCTVNVTLPVGVIDLYVLAYTGTNGTGTFLASSVTTVQVNSNATLTQPGTTTTTTLNTLGAALGSVTLGAIAAIVPNGLPNSSIAAGSYPANTAPNVYSAAGTITATDASSNTIPANNAIQPVTITDTDTSGATCLVYIPSGASTATPCPFASAASSVTMNNSSDSYAVLYNGKFVPAGTLNITASIASPAPATTPAPITVSITPTVFSMGSISFARGAGPIGALVYDPMNGTVYAGTGNSSTPLYGVTYGASGFGTPTAVNVTSVNGVAATALSSAGTNYYYVSAGVNAAIIGPDNNIWMIEHNGEPGNTNCCLPQYVAVAVLHTAVVNPNGGAAIQPGPGVFAEYTVFSSPGSSGYATTPLHGIASMGGFIWVIDKDGGFWRINPATGLVSPNLSPGYSPGTTPTEPVNGGFPITDPTGATPISGTSSRKSFFSPLVPLGSTLYAVNGKNSAFDAFAVDTTAAPSAGLCTPAGPPPCIATYQESLIGSLTGTRGSGNFAAGGGTDGTSVYALNSSKQVYKVTPPSTMATSAGAYTLTNGGGIFLTPDNWLWTLSDGGVQALTSMTSSAAPVTPTTVSACGSQAYLDRGSFPMTLVPNGTLVFTPVISSGTATSSAVLCGVVY